MSWLYPAYTSKALLDLGIPFGDGVTLAVGGENVLGTYSDVHSTDATGNRSETHACAPSRIAGATPSITVGRVLPKNSWTVGLTIICIYAAVSSQTRSHRPIHRADLWRRWWPRPKGCRNARRSPLSIARKVVARCRLDSSHAFSTGRQSRPRPHRFEYLARHDRER